METQVIVRRAKKTWRQVRGTLFRNLMALLVALTHVLIIGTPIGDRLENFTLSLWFRLRGAISAPSEIEIIAIDQNSYRALNIPYIDPWPRGKQAELLELLSKAGAKLAILDFFMLDPGHFQDQNERLVQAMTKIPTFIGSYIRRDNANGEAIVETPQPFFAKAANKVVNLNVLTEAGVRRFFLNTPENTPKPLIYEFADFIGKSGQLPSPTDLIKYYGPPGSIRATPVFEMFNLSPEALHQRYNNKIVFVGTQLSIGVGLAMKDAFLTPTSSSDMSGVEIHATTVANILEQNWIRRSPPALEQLVLNLLAFFICALIVAAKPIRGLLLMCLAQSIWLLIAYKGFLQGIFIPGFTLCFITLPYMLCIASIYYFLVVMRSHSQIEDALGVKIHLNE